MARLKDSASIHALAGCGGAVLASAITYPFATISSRLQVQSEDAKEKR